MNKATVEPGTRTCDMMVLPHRASRMRPCDQPVYKKGLCKSCWDSENWEAPDDSA